MPISQKHAVSPEWFGNRKMINRFSRIQQRLAKETVWLHIVAPPDTVVDYPALPFKFLIRFQPPGQYRLLVQAPVPLVLKHLAKIDAEFIQPINLGRIVKIRIQSVVVNHILFILTAGKMIEISGPAQTQRPAEIPKSA